MAETKKISKQQKQMLAAGGGLLVLLLLYRWYRARSPAAAGSSTGNAGQQAASDYAGLAGQQQSDVAALQGQEQSDFANLQGAMAAQSAQEQSDVTGLTGTLAGITAALTNLQDQFTAVASGNAPPPAGGTIPPGDTGGFPGSKIGGVLGSTSWTSQPWASGAVPAVGATTPATPITAILAQPSAAVAAAAGWISNGPASVAAALGGESPHSPAHQNGNAGNPFSSNAGGSVAAVSQSQKPGIRGPGESPSTITTSVPDSKQVNAKNAKSAVGQALNKQPPKSTSTPKKK